MHLEDLGYQVMTAAEPTSCPVYEHAHCSASTPCADVIFIDQTMPAMTGLEFLKLQAERGCKLLPKFKMLMTGDLSQSVRQQAEEIGCQVAQKPLRLDDVTHFVQQVVQNRNPK